MSDNYCEPEGDLPTVDEVNEILQRKLASGEVHIVLNPDVPRDPKKCEIAFMN